MRMPTLRIEEKVAVVKLCIQAETGEWMRAFAERTKFRYQTKPVFIRPFGWETFEGQEP